MNLLLAICLFWGLLVAGSQLYAHPRLRWLAYLLTAGAGLALPLARWPDSSALLTARGDINGGFVLGVAVGLAAAPIGLVALVLLRMASAGAILVYPTPRPALAQTSRPAAASRGGGSGKPGNVAADNSTCALLLLLLIPLLGIGIASLIKQRGQPCRACQEAADQLFHQLEAQPIYVGLEGSSRPPIVLPEAWARERQQQLAEVPLLTCRHINVSLLERTWPLVLANAVLLLALVLVFAP